MHKHTPATRSAIASILLAALASTCPALARQKFKPLELAPTENASPLAGESWPVLVMVMSSGTPIFNGEEVTLPELAGRIRDALWGKPAPEQRVYVMADRYAPAESVRAVMNAMREVGHDTLTLVTADANRAGARAGVDAEVWIPPDARIAPEDRLTGIPPPPEEKTSRSDQPPPPLPPPPPPARRAPKGKPRPVPAFDVVVVEPVEVPDAAPRVRLGDREMELAAAAAMLSPVAREESGTMIVTRAPRTGRFENVVAVVDALLGAGVIRVLIAIDDFDVPPFDSRRMVRTGVPGGVPGGTPGGIPGGVPGGVSDEDIPEPPPVATSRRSVVRLTGAALRERATARVDPPYPELARTAGVEGAVVVEVVVGADGTVASAKAISGHPLLRDAAVEAARQWRFRPVMRQGRAVVAVGALTFAFRK